MTSITTSQDSKATLQIEKIISLATVERSAFNEILIIVDNSQKKTPNQFGKTTCNIVKIYLMKDSKKIEELMLEGDDIDLWNYYITPNAIWDSEFLQVQIFVDKPRKEYSGKQCIPKRMFKLVETPQNRTFIRELKLVAETIRNERL